MTTAPQTVFENVSSEDVYPVLHSLMATVSHAIEGAVLHIGTHPIYGKMMIVEAAWGLSTLCYPFES
jgi:hypothetical protein